MKKIRILSLLMAVIMLFGAVALLSSCKKSDGIVALKGKPKEVDVSGYAVLYGDSISGIEFTSTYMNEITEFASSLSEATGESYFATSYKNRKTTDTDKEILIGVTPDAESQELLGEIKQDGFAIAVTENKILILGTTNLLTLMALEYFTESYLNVEEPTTTLKIHKSAMAHDVEHITLADSKRAEKEETAVEDYTYVCSDKIGKLPSSYAGTGSKNEDSTYQEYEQVAVEEVVDHMKKLSGIHGKYFPTGTDKTDHLKEVHIGRVDRDATRAALADTAAEEFVVDFQGDKIVVSGWSEYTVCAAVAAYENLVAEGIEASDDSVVIRVPKGLTVRGIANDKWVTDFPKPTGEGINLYNAMDGNDNAYQYLYTGEGVNASAYRAYCDQLKSAGYTLYGTETEAEGSLFATYVNKSEGKMLHVAYNAYAHKDDFADFDWVATKKKTGDKGVYEYDPALRIVSAPLDSAYLPDEKLYQPNTTYTKVTDSMVTTMPLGSGAVGLVYIVTLEDGSFIVFDGGNVSTEGEEYDRLWKTLSALHKEIYGAAPSKANPVRIAAWVLTHAHGDHYDVFWQMSKAYGATGQLKMDYMIANIPAEHSFYPVRKTANAIKPEHIVKLKGFFADGFTYIKAHTGQKFYLANCEIQVLTTWEDLNPLVPNNSNDTNTVLRFALSNKDAPNAPKNVQVWTGDANRWQSRYMCAMYGDYLKADMVSIAHHGNNGCEIDFYEMVDPVAVWWPHNVPSIKNYLNASKKDSDFRHQVDQYVCRELESVKYVYASGATNNSLDELYFTTVRITAAGAQYENPFDVVTGQQLGALYTSVNSPSALMKK